MHIKTIAPIRNDRAGSGHYGASRGTRKHTGVDFYVAPGSIVLAPESGEMEHYGYAYRGDTNWRIVNFKGNSGRLYRFFYTVQCGYKRGDRVERGQPIAMVQDIRKRYPEESDMQPHVHVEVLDGNGVRLNPEKL